MTKNINVSIAADIEEEVAEALALLAETYPDLSVSGRVCLALVEWRDWFYFQVKWDQESAEVDQWRREHANNRLDA